MAEACSPLLLLATLSTWPSLSTYPYQSLVAQYHSQTRRLLVHDTAFCLDTTPPSFPRTSISHIVVVVGRISHSIVHLRYHVLYTTVTISNKSRIEAAPDLRLRSNSGFRFRFRSTRSPHCVELSLSLTNHSTNQPTKVKLKKIHTGIFNEPYERKTALASASKPKVL